MDRFFSKLDLRDIKIKPEGTRFLPTEDDVEVDESNQDAVPEHYNLNPTLAPTFDSQVQEPVFPAPQAAEPGYANGASSHQLDGDVAEPVVYENDEVLKVSAKSRPSAVAGAIAGVVRDAGRAEVQAIGAGATNQAVKAVAIARDYLLESGIDAVCVPAFIDVTIDNEERTAIRLVVETR
jgi:stage V sporulation protein S